MTRQAGVLLPLFSMPSRSSWGIGEIPDLVPVTAWLATGGFSQLLLLPIFAIPQKETSPYSATSAMAIDPIYIGIDALPDFKRAGGKRALSPASAEHLKAAREAPAVCYDRVRPAKREALELAFGRFEADEWARSSSRASELAAYAERERWWLDDYALHQALADDLDAQSWRAWPARLRRRDPAVLEEARRRLAKAILRQQYWQWLAETQWHDARSAAEAAGVRLFGDLPFLVGAGSVDVWVRQDEFDLTVSVGAPPDAFSAKGQNWNLPRFRWEVAAASDYEWLRHRLRRMAALFDGVRVDHVVGLYRTYVRPRRGRGRFIPSKGAAQAAQGESLLRVLLDSPLHLVAEDLGVVPPYVRRSLDRLMVTGTRVLRWERERKRVGRPFRDPASYPAASCAMTGTHDTETLAAWWARAPLTERKAVAALPYLREQGVDPRQPWTDEVHRALLEQMYRAGSETVIFPSQDLFGWSDRINTPGTINERNWSWRLPWPVDTLGEQPEAVARAAACRDLAEASGRA